MKPIINFLTVAVSALLFSNCNKPKDYTTDYLRGKIDGVAFECNVNLKASQPHRNYSLGVNDPAILVTGEGPMYSITLNIHGEWSSLSSGSYVFEASKNRSATIWYNRSDAYYAGPAPNGLKGNGKITILEINNNYIKGNFEFVASGEMPFLSKTVTEGEFFIKRSK